MRVVPLLLITLIAAPAAAHIQLNGPMRRSDSQKDGPCGAPGSVRGPTVKTYAPGDTITVTWDETVGHPGHYRIAFDDDGQDFPNPVDDDDAFPEVLLDDITDNPGEAGYSAQVTLPNIECSNCTLQLIQVMTTTPPYVEGDLYYQCADVVLSNAAPGEPDAGAGEPGDDAGGDDDAPGDDDGGSSPGKASGGCAAGGGAGPAALFGLLAALLRRRR